MCVDVRAFVSHDATSMKRVRCSMKYRRFTCQYWCEPTLQAIEIPEDEPGVILRYDKQVTNAEKALSMYDAGR